MIFPLVLLVGYSGLPSRSAVPGSDLPGAFNNLLYFEAVAAEPGGYGLSFCHR